MQRKLWILCRQREDKGFDYVCALPGDGGKDWEYTKDRTKAIAVNAYWQKRYMADMIRVNAKNPKSFVVIY